MVMLKTPLWLRSFRLYLSKVLCLHRHSITTGSEIKTREYYGYEWKAQYIGRKCSHCGKEWQEIKNNERDPQYKAALKLSKQ